MPRNDLARFPFYVQITVAGRKRKLRVASTVENPEIGIEVFQTNSMGRSRRTYYMKLMKQRYPDGMEASKADVMDEQLNIKHRSTVVCKNAPLPVGR